jgi:hypothetical protein
MALNYFVVVTANIFENLFDKIIEVNSTEVNDWCACIENCV